MKPEPDIKPWKQFLGNVPTTLALPDYHSNYFAYGFDWKKNPNLGLQITGEFGYARYMSYNIYGEVSGASLNARRDVEIEPQPGNVNPFRPGNSPDAANRQYMVNVFCKDNASPATKALINPLTFTKDDVKLRDGLALLVVILRYYLPKDKDKIAKVPIPVIKAFDTEHDQPFPLPPNSVIENMPTRIYEEQLLPIFPTIVDNTLRFYHVAGSGEFNNKDNLYLLNAVDKQPNEVLLLKLQAPLYGLLTSQPPEPQVRYWSFNEGDVNTSTPMGMPDQDFKMAKDGLTYIAIGDEAIMKWAHQGGYNFMPWKVQSSRRAVVLYRNLVSDPITFPGWIKKVKQADFKQTPISGNNDPRITSLDAKNFIGSYAPTGKKVTQAEFMRNYGGMPSPGFKTVG